MRRDIVTGAFCASAIFETFLEGEGGIFLSRFDLDAPKVELAASIF